MKNNKGITLIALVITIVVLLILVGVVAISITGENGIIGKASDSKTESRASKVEDRVEMWKEARYADSWLENDTEMELEEFVDQLASEGLLIGDEPTTAKETHEITIGSKTISFDPELSNGDTVPAITSYTGCYADFEGDGIIDGVIYADLAVAGSGEFGSNGNGTYSWSQVTSGLKQYYVSQQDYEGDYGTVNVLTPVDGTSGTDRFYVMALDDISISSSEYCWYSSARSNSNTTVVTSTEFGTGKANTNTMISKWNSSSYGSQNSNSSYPDIWGVIQEEVAKGWFVPSKEELVAFGDWLYTTLGDYVNYYSMGFRQHYWTSSQTRDGSVYNARIGHGGGLDDAGESFGQSRTLDYNNTAAVRLSTTF